MKRNQDDTFVSRNRAISFRNELKWGRREVEEQKLGRFDRLLSSRAVKSSASEEEEEEEGQGT